MAVNILPRTHAVTTGDFFRACTVIFSSVDDVICAAMGFQVFLSGVVGFLCTVSELTVVDFCAHARSLKAEAQKL